MDLLLLTDSVVGVLAGVAIIYLVRVERELARVRTYEGEFKDFIQVFTTSISKAENILKALMDHAPKILKQTDRQIEEAKTTCDDLKFITDRASDIGQYLEQYQFPKKGDAPHAVKPVVKAGETSKATSKFTLSSPEKTAITVQRIESPAPVLREDAIQIDKRADVLNLDEYKVPVENLVKSAPLATKSQDSNDVLRAIESLADKLMHNKVNPAMMPEPKETSAAPQSPAIVTHPLIQEQPRESVVLPFGGVQAERPIVPAIQEAEAVDAVQEVLAQGTADKSEIDQLFNLLDQYKNMRDNARTHLAPSDTQDVNYELEQEANQYQEGDTATHLFKKASV